MFICLVPKLTSIYFLYFPLIMLKEWSEFWKVRKKTVILRGIMGVNMSYSQSQVQSQTQVQQQRFSNKQVQLMRLLEMPLAQFEQSVETELNENEALLEDYSKDPSEADISEGMEIDFGNTPRMSSKSSEEDKNSDDASRESEGFEDEQTDYASDDSAPDYDSSMLNGVLYDDNDAPDRRHVMEQVLNDSETLYQQLVDQIKMLDLTTEEMQLMEYIIGMLDDDGLLTKSPLVMAEELFLFQGIETNAEQMQGLVDQLKMLDPAGIGAQSLQECLLIQVGRRKKSAVTTVMKRILTDCFKLFMAGRTDKIYHKIDEDPSLIDEAVEKIRHLNPRPGAGLGEGIGDIVQHVTPDFIVETENDEVRFSINYGKVPALAVTEDYDDLIKQYEGVDREKIRKKEYEAYVYARSRVKRANSFIHLVKLRFRTLYLTMKHIVDRQKAFFLSGDDNDLKPLLIREIAEKMDYDISTISRVCSNKYVQTEWGIFPMKHFFGVSYSAKSADGEEITLQQILSAIREIIDSEDKKNPYSDDVISQMLKEKGLNLARRTVAKHRERLGYSTARLRKIKSPD